jgi:hypothetical protein
MRYSWGTKEAADNCGGQKEERGRARTTFDRKTEMSFVVYQEYKTNAQIVSKSKVVSGK